MNRIRVLWIDDGAIADMAELVGPVYSSGRYDLMIATNVSDAVDQITRQEFDVVVVDIRLPPGEGKEWIRIYQEREQSRSRARLGLELLAWCLGKHSRVDLGAPPKWVAPKRFGVFTVEEKAVVGRRLEELGVSVHRQKTADPSRRALLDLIELILTKT